MIKKILILLLLASTALGQNWNNPGQKPWLGQQVDRSHPCAKGLVACWLMNEGTGNQIQDLSGNRNNGILTNDVWWVAGKFGSALDFEGTTDHVNCGNSSLFDFNATDGFSVSCWFKADTVSGDHTVVGKAASAWFLNVWNDDIQFRIETSGDAIDTYNVGTNAFQVEKWYHLVGVAKGTTAWAYVNGVLAASGVGSGTYNTDAASPVLIGANTITGQYDFDGIIDNVLIYNRALSATEIALLYREPFCFMADDLPVSMMYDYSGAAPSGQVIFIQFSAIPILFITTFLLIRKRRRYVE